MQIFKQMRLEHWKKNHCVVHKWKKKLCVNAPLRWNVEQKTFGLEKFEFQANFRATAAAQKSSATFSKAQLKKFHFLTVVLFTFACFF